MATRCPRCRYWLENPRDLACPSCGYSLRLPIVGKVGAVLVAVGFLAYLVALFWEALWVEILAGGTAAIVLGMIALLAAGRMIGRARRA